MICRGHYAPQRARGSFNAFSRDIWEAIESVAFCSQEKNGKATKTEQRRVVRLEPAGNLTRRRSRGSFRSLTILFGD
jgi:hypothetical protein